MAVATVGVGERFPVDELARAGAPVGADGTLGAPTVVYFYPEASTPTCTIEAQGFNRLYDEFRAAGVEVIGVSVDTDEDNASFARECNLRFPLVSDPEQSLVRALGVAKDYGEYGILAARVSFLLDGNGVVRSIWEV